jgi:colanic acid/amylovoran biosynthesis glycosyltransferase
MKQSGASLTHPTGHGMNAVHRPFRLAVFTSRYPGRVSTFFERDMLALVRAGIEVDVFPLRPYDPTLWRYSLVVDDHLLPRDRVHNIGMLEGLRPPWPLSRLALCLRDAAAVAVSAVRFGPIPLAKTLYAVPKALAWAARQAGPYDHVLAYWGGYAATCAYLFHRLTQPGVPFSIWLHAGADLYFRPIFMRQKLRYADRIITCCEFNRRYIHERFPDVADRLNGRIHVAYHGLDLARFPYVPDGRPATRLIAVGRFSPGKGFDMLLQAVGGLAQRGHPVELELVGDGPEAPALRTLAEALGIADRVRFRGWLPFAEVQAAMQAATVLVHPSIGLGDGLPNVLREAMAVGTPVIASDVAGIPEALDWGNAGVLVPPRDVPTLTEAIARLLADEALRRRLAEAGRRRTEDLFDAWRNGARLAEVLRATRRGDGAGGAS